MVEIEWRTIQFFLGDEGVSEVAADVLDAKKMKCTCSEFFSSAKCKHIKHIKKRIVESGGTYQISTPSSASDDLAEMAMTDSELWREFMIKFARVETL